MTVFPLPAVASIAQSLALESAIDAAIAAAGADGLCIDASALSEFDTAAVALLLHAQRAARARGLPLQLAGAPARLHDLARLYGVEELLPGAAV